MSKFFVRAYIPFLIIVSLLSLVLFSCLIGAPSTDDKEESVLKDGGSQKEDKTEDTVEDETEDTVEDETEDAPDGAAANVQATSSAEGQVSVTWNNPSAEGFENVFDEPSFRVCATLAGTTRDGNHQLDASSDPQLVRRYAGPQSDGRCGFESYGSGADHSYSKTLDHHHDGIMPHEEYLIVVVTEDINDRSKRAYSRVVPVRAR